MNSHYYLCDKESIVHLQKNRFIYVYLYKDLLVARTDNKHYISRIGGPLSENELSFTRHTYVLMESLNNDDLIMLKLRGHYVEKRSVRDFSAPLINSLLSNITIWTEV